MESVEAELIANGFLFIVKTPLYGLEKALVCKGGGQDSDIYFFSLDLQVNTR